MEAHYRFGKMCVCDYYFVVLNHTKADLGSDFRLITNLVSTHQLNKLYIYYKHTDKV